MVPSGAQAVVVNLTAINHSATHTYVTAFPAGSVPVASNMNLNPDAVQSNLAIVQLTSGGAITLYNAVGSVDAIVDVQGYFSAPSLGSPPPGEFHSIAPVRICDRRANQRTQCAGATNNPLPANTWRRIVLSGAGSIPATGAAAAVFNLTATQGTLATYLAVAPPNASDQCPTGAQGRQRSIQKPVSACQTALFPHSARRATSASTTLSAASSSSSTSAAGSALAVKRPPAPSSTPFRRPASATPAVARELAAPAQTLFP